MTPDGKTTEPGHTLVRDHLVAVRAAADSDLGAAPKARDLLCTTISKWLGELDGDPAEVNRAHDAGMDVVAQFRRPIPMPAPARRGAPVDYRSHTRAVLNLAEHGWLIDPRPIAGERTLRVAIGEPFGEQR